MQLPGSRAQQTRDLTLGAPAYLTLAAAQTGVQLLLPEAKMRSMFWFMNLSDTAMYLAFGGARAGAVTLSGGKVTAVAVANAGFGYTVPPDVHFFGGGDGGAGGAFVGVGDIGYPTPGDAGMAPPRSNLSGQLPATAHCNLTSNAVASITIDNGGAAYKVAPLAFLRNNRLDPVGAAIASATEGFLIQANGGSMYLNGTNTPTDQISLFCSATGKAYYFRYMP